MNLLPSSTRPLLAKASIVAAALLSAVAFDAAAQVSVTSIHSFNGTDGFGPMAGLVQGSDGALYGTTSGQVASPVVGTVFRLDRVSLGVSVLHSFTDGARPFSGLTLGAGGMLYGTTYTGGSNDLGTLFSVAPNGQLFATLHSFDGSAGAKPDDAALTQAADGFFLGTTSEGGPGGGGTIFRSDPATQAVSVLASFQAAAGVDAGLIAGRDGNWYGTTYTGGTNGLGSVFRINATTGEMTTLHDFTGADGQNPVAGALMQGSDGMLYGTTQLPGYGRVYKINPATAALTILHAFSATVGEGRTPLGGVTEGGDGYLYGTTVLGGQGYGTIYRVHPTTLAYNVVAPFGGSNGRSPSGNLLRADDGALYGTTRLGGTYNAGTVFRVSLPTTKDTVPPTIASISASPSELRPANGKMVPVTLTVVATDAIDTAPKCTITGVTGNQTIGGDWKVTGDLTVSLRAKLSGKTARIYTIAVRCTDASGNAETGTVNVTVPK